MLYPLSYGGRPVDVRVAARDGPRLPAPDAAGGQVEDPPEVSPLGRDGPAPGRRHLTDPASIEAWWGHPAAFPGGVRAGVTGTFEHEGQRFPIALRIVEPPATFAFRWGSFGEAEPGPEACDVRFDLEPTATGTRITVVESGWMRVPDRERDDRMEQNVGGWEFVLDSLRRHVLGAQTVGAA